MLSFVFIKHTYPTSDITICAEAAVYVQHILAKTSQLKEIVYYDKRPVSVFSHALSNKTIKCFIANTLSTYFKPHEVLFSARFCSQGDKTM